MNEDSLSPYRQRIFFCVKTLLRRFFSALFLLVFSPLLLVIDIFARSRPEEACAAQGRTRLKLLCAYLLFMTGISVAVTFLYFESTREARRLETVLGVFSTRRKSGAILPRRLWRLYINMRSALTSTRIWF